MQDLELRQFIERVKLRSPIEVVVGERVSALKQRGSKYWACCPFHQERTPSFSVDPGRGTWHCWGACGEGGDALAFIQRFDGLSFLDALRLLARQCGEELPERTLRGRTQGAEAAEEARYELLRWAAGVYREAWRSADGTLARSYMKKRGLAETTLETFGIGWASESGQALVGAVQRDKKPLDGLIELGLARRSESGRPYDFFRGRVLIPIRERLGRTVGFGGRILIESADETTGPKYLNTPETPLFHKGRLIFGLDLAAAEIRASHRLLIVEGYTDVMAAHQAGWKGAVAVLGTSTTADHAALVRRSGARTVVLVFDGDQAGRKASTRALAGLLGLSVELRVAVLPEGRDPGDLLVEPSGAETFRACVEGARGWFDWCVAGLVDKRGRELAAAVEELFPLLAALENAVERSAHLNELSLALSLPVADLRERWDAFARGRRRAAAEAPRPVETPARRAPRTATERGLVQAYGLLLGALLLDNSLVPLYAPLAADCPPTEGGELELFFRTLLELYEHDESGAPISVSRLLTVLGDHPARSRLVELVSVAGEAESAEILARDQARWIERVRRERELESMKSALGSDTAPDVLERLHHELRVGRVPSAKLATDRSPRVP